MKSTIVKLILTLILFLLIGTVKVTFAIELFQSVPGVTCGVGGSTEKNARCCGAKKSQFIRIPGWFDKIPFIGSKIKGFHDKLDEVEKIQDDLEAEPCLIGTPSMTDYSNKNCKCEYVVVASASASMREMCTQYLISPTELRKCLSCVNDRGGLYGGVGCIPLNMPDFIGNFLLVWGIGFAGGIALLCIIYSAFRMQTSMGNPEAIKKAQENLTACITGLVLIIFSVFILRLIGVSILRIPFLN